MGTPVPSHRECLRNCKTRISCGAPKRTSTLTLLANDREICISPRSPICLNSTSTSAPYSLSPGLSVATRLRRILYVNGPMTERKTARFLSAATKKYSTFYCFTNSVKLLHFPQSSGSHRSRPRRQNMWYASRGACASESVTNTYVHYHATIKEVTHLGHILTYNLDDKPDIIRAVKDMNRKANSVLCRFSALDPFIIIKTYCLSLYGCSLWSLSSPSIKIIEVASY